MTLAKRVKKSESKESPRLKLMLFGKSGVGKTYGSMWPHSYVLDGERGTVHYGDMLAERNCARVITSDTSEAISQIRDLMTTKHDYKTLVIDPITAYYEDSQQKWTDLFVAQAKRDGKAYAAEMQDFGFRYWGKVKAEQKHLISLLKRIDMNVICTAHEKDQYGDNMKILGQTYDGLKGLDYLFDTVIRLMKSGEQRVAFTIKDRTGKFPQRFDYTYDKILEIWGNGIEREASNLTLATEAQVSSLKELLGIIQVEESWETNCLRKAGVESWDEMDTATIQKCIDYLAKKVPNYSKPKKEVKDENATRA